MRWTHRTRFQVTRGTPIPDTNLSVDAGWEGVLVLEAEGTNEGLADLQLRCGMEWFKPQPGVQPKQGDGGRVFRLIRERRSVYLTDGHIHWLMFMAVVLAKFGSAPFA